MFQRQRSLFCIQIHTFRKKLVESYYTRTETKEVKASMSKPRVILGTMTFGGSTTSDADATAMLLDFCTEPKWKEIVKEDPMLDTAIMYQGGKTEQFLGKLLKQGKFPSTLSIATKANPFTKDTNLSPAGIRDQLVSSLDALQVESVDIYYLHGPDANNPIEATLEEVQKLHTEGKFRTFGLSNFSAWETVYIHGYMKSRNYILPTVYQGMYNAITRMVEKDLFPALRKLNIRFYAYNPLAGGMLSGKYQPSENADEAAKLNSAVGNRFSGTGLWARMYRDRFQKQEQFAALDVVRESLGEGESMAEASLRWIRHHSKLMEQDGIIIGASKTSHYDSNMQALSQGPLPDKLVQAFDEAAKLCESVCPDYARGYSGSAIPES
eukprot:scaffold2141_cov120-Cylindrotheca_fusiformis.AAC.15